MGEAIHFDGGAFDGAVLFAAAFDDCKSHFITLQSFTSPVRRPDCTSLMVLDVVGSLSMIFCVMPSRLVSNCITFLGINGKFLRIGSKVSRILFAIRAYFTVRV